MRLFLYFALIFQLIQGAKILLYNPSFGYSHFKFLGRIGDILVENGHEVTEIIPMIYPPDFKPVSKLTKVIKIPEDSRVREMNELAQKNGGAYKKMWTMEPTPQAMSKLATKMARMFTYTCENVLENKEMWIHLKDQKFDIGISEAFDFCGFGVLEMLGVRTYVTASSSIMLDHLAAMIGQPVVLSYVPGSIGDVTEQMSFTQRAFNALGSFIGSQIFLGIMRTENEMFRKKVAEDFPDLAELVSDNSALVFTNSVPYLDFPHPTLHKVHEIGGIGIPTVKPLNEEWNAVLNKKSKTVYISFGSVAKSKEMPSELKESVIETVKRHPDVQFIWKYEDDDLTDLPPNLYLSKWTPQSDLINDPRTSLFITHGGLASVTEIAYSGVPAICVPLFADQPRNAVMLKRQGVAESLSKYDFADADKLSAMIEKFLTNDSYKKNATRLASLLHSVPFKPEEILVKNVNFLAKVGHFKQLDPYGRKLSFVQYFLLDVIFAFVGIIVLIIAILVIIAGKLLCFCSRNVKPKHE